MPQRKESSFASSALFLVQTAVTSKSCSSDTSHRYKTESPGVNILICALCQPSAGAVAKAHRLGSDFAHLINASTLPFAWCSFMFHFKNQQ